MVLSQFSLSFAWLASSASAWFMALSGLVLGYFLPGYFLSSILRSPEMLVSSFVISLLVLFSGVMLFQLLGVPISFAPMMTYLSVISCLLGYIAVCYRPRSDPEKPPCEPLSFQHCTIVALVAITLFFLFCRITVHPLPGPDTVFRWNLLARRLLELGNLDFYPPRLPGDFRIYFYVDAMPAFVASSYWWLYSCLGGYYPQFTSALILFQTLSILVLVYRLASHVYSPVAGLLAMGILCSSRLFLWASSMGQETGYTALSLVGILFFLNNGKQRSQMSAAVLAALFCSLGILAREYGWCFLACGLISMAFFGYARRPLCLFLFVSFICGAPWYLRTLILTANPFYSIDVAGLFPVNPVFGQIMENLSNHIGVRTWRLHDWQMHISAVVLLAPLPCVFALLEVCREPQRCRIYMASALLVFITWLFSVGFTANVAYSLRVLNPFVCILAVLAGGFAASRMRFRSSRFVYFSVIVITLCTTSAYALAFPFQPQEIPLRYWPKMLIHRQAVTLPESKIRNLLPELRKYGSRTLADSHYFYTELLGTEVEVVPIWSPEVSFLFLDYVPAEEMQRRLIELGIHSAVLLDIPLMNKFYEQSSLYRFLRKSCMPSLRGPNFSVYSLRSVSIPQ